MPLNRIGFCYCSPVHSNQILWSKDLGSPFAKICEIQKKCVIQRYVSGLHNMWVANQSSGLAPRQAQTKKGSSVEKRLLERGYNSDL